MYIVPSCIVLLDNVLRPCILLSRRRRVPKLSWKKMAQLFVVSGLSAETRNCAL